MPLLSLLFPSGPTSDVHDADDEAAEQFGDEPYAGAFGGDDDSDLLDALGFDYED